ncbi:MAG: hypothetical protein MJK18_08410, partial [Bdellovibrionales bacterium]|nr:hypothetical protein [Bdellovibrionales bacterium]
MERLTQLGIAVFLILFYFMAEADSIELDPSSFYNNKTITVEKPGRAGFKFTVRARFVGEPAIRPMYLHTGVRCPGDEEMHPVDLGALLRKYTGEASDLYLAAPTRHYSAGQIHVCSLESV